MSYEEILEILERENYKDVIKAIFKFDTGKADWDEIDVMAQDFIDDKCRCSFLDEDLH